jgi:hypothetical protein
MGRRSLLLTIIVLFSFIFTVSCTSEKAEVKIIPEFIIEKGNQFIISKVGAEYFNKYITFNSSDSKYVVGTDYHQASFLNNASYLMVYSFRIPDKPWVNESLSFFMDLQGNVVAVSPAIPDIINHPEEGEFPIDKQMAVEIAKNAGLEPGIKDWEAIFHWYYGDPETFVWTVRNTLSESDIGGYGKVIVIDANDGKVLMKSEYTWGL